MAWQNRFDCAHPHTGVRFLAKHVVAAVAVEVEKESLENVNRKIETL